MTGEEVGRQWRGDVMLSGVGPPWARMHIHERKGQNEVCMGVREGHIERREDGCRKTKKNYRR